MGLICFLKNKWIKNKRNKLTVARERIEDEIELLVDVEVFMAEDHSPEIAN